MAVSVKDRLHICMFSNLFPPIDSGSSLFTWRLSRKLAGRGHRVVVITAQQDSQVPYEECEGVVIHRLPAMRLPQLALAHNFKWMTVTFTPRNLVRIRGIFARERFDIIHQQNHVFDTILSSPRMARRYHLPLILTVHTQAEHTYPIYDLILLLLDRVARRVIFDRADRVISPESNVEKYVRLRHGITDSPIIPYGVELSRPQPGEVQRLKQRFNTGRGPLILSLGHVNYLRDRMDLITALPDVLQCFPTAHLLIVGEVCVREPLLLVRNLGLEQHVTFTGALPNRLIPALFELADVEAHTGTTTQYEGPGIATMEAMAAGLPVVTMAIDATSSYDEFRNWENVVMVPPNDPCKMAAALLRLLSDEPLQRRIGHNARRLIERRYAMAAVCKAHEDLYHQTIRMHRQVT